MFGFLKDKLKKAVGKFSKDVEKEVVIEKKETILEESSPKKDLETDLEPKKKGFFKKIFGKKDSESIIEKKEDVTQDFNQDFTPELENVNKTETKNKIEILQDLEEKKPEKKDENKVEKSAPIIEGIEDIEDFTEQPIEEKKDLKSLKKEIPKEEAEKKGLFSKITETFTKFNITEEKFEELFWDLELVMLENNIAVEVIDKIKSDMKKELMSGKINRKGINEMIAATLKNSIIDLFDIVPINLIKDIHNKKDKPYIITIIGVNGSGKTTSIAKLTNMLQKKGLKVVLAASDTFRAAAIQQLEEHANKLNTKIIKHDYNSDPAAVAFDAIKYAQAKNIDVVIIDTAGRLHSNTNLMRELEKIVRVCKPDIKIFVGESITGNDCVEQAKEFDNTVGIDAIILAKADIDEKGGAAISVSYVTQKPILYLGTGQTYDDLKEFDPKLIIESLEL